MMNNSTFPSDEIAVPAPLWLRVLYILFLVIIHFVGVPSNIVAAIVYGRTSPKTACDWLILTMSITDAFVCFCSPALYLQADLEIYIPWKTQVFCRLENWLHLTAMIASCILLVIIAIDRYVKICRPEIRSLTPPMARNVCLLCVVVAAAVCLYPFADPVEDEQCFIRDLKFRDGIKIFYTVMFCCFVVSFVIVTFAYASVCQQISDKIKLKQRLVKDNGLTPSSNNQNVCQTEKQYHIGLGRFTWSFSKWCHKSQKKMDSACSNIENEGKSHMEIKCAGSNNTEDMSRHRSEYSAMDEQFVPLNSYPETNFSDTLNVVSNEPGNSHGNASSSYTKCDTAAACTCHVKIQDNDNNDSSLVHRSKDNVLKNNLQGIHSPGSQRIPPGVCYFCLSRVSVSEPNTTDTRHERDDMIALVTSARQAENKKKLNYSSSFVEKSESKDLSLNTAQSSDKPSPDRIKLADGHGDTLTWNSQTKTHAGNAKTLTQIKLPLNQKCLVDIKDFKPLSDCKTLSSCRELCEGNHSSSKIVSSPKLSSVQSLPSTKCLKTDGTTLLESNSDSILGAGCTAILGVSYNSMLSSDRKSMLDVECKAAKSTPFVLLSACRRSMSSFDCTRNGKPYDSNCSMYKTLVNCYCSLHVNCEDSSKFISCRRDGKAGSCKTKLQRSLSWPSLVQPTSSSMYCSSCDIIYNEIYDHFHSHFKTQHHHLVMSESRQTGSHNVTNTAIARSETLDVTRSDSSQHPTERTDVSHFHHHGHKVVLCQAKDLQPGFSSNESVFSVTEQKQPEISETVYEAQHARLDQSEHGDFKQITNHLENTKESNCINEINNLQFNIKDTMTLDVPFNVKDSTTLDLPPSFTRSALRSSGSLCSRGSNKSPSFADPLLSELQPETDSHWPDNDEGVNDVSTALFFCKWRGQREKQVCKTSRGSVRSTASRKRFARERQMTLMLLSVTAAFLLSWIPPWIIFMLCFFGAPEYSTSAVYRYISTLHLVNYIASPIIYFTFNPTYRSKVKNLFPSCCDRNKGLVM